MNIKFRFFRDLSPGQRLAVFKVFGVLADGFDGKLTHGEEAQLLAEMLAGIRGAPTAASEGAAQYKAQRDNLLAFMKNAPVSSGVCCCGDDMTRHGNPMHCGHNPVDMWDHSVLSLAADIEAFDLATSPPQIALDHEQQTAAQFSSLK